MVAAYYFHRTLWPDGRLRMGMARMAVAREASVRQVLERESGGLVITLWRLPTLLGGLIDVLTGWRLGRIDAAVLGEFLRDLGLMQTAGIPMIDALSALAQERQAGGGSGAVSTLAAELHADLQRGQALSDAMARYGHWFPETVTNLVRIGEQTGNVGPMLQQGAEHVERLQKIRRDIRATLIYPTFVFASMFAVAAFWILYVIPNLAKLFQQLRAELPAITRMTVAFAHGLAAHLPVVLIVLAGAFICYFWALRRFESVARFTHEGLHRLPVIKRLMVASGMALMTEHLALLVRAGVDMVSAWEVLIRTTRDRYYRWRLQTIYGALRNGDTVGAAMGRVGGFPPMVVRMIGVGESTGKLDEQLFHLANEYRARLEVLVRSLSEVLKPLIILVAGALFLFLIVSMMLPVYDLVRQTVARNLGG